VCVGDYDNDGKRRSVRDIFSGKNVLYHNNGNGTFTDVTKRREWEGTASVGTTVAIFSTMIATVILDLFVANYIDLDLATAPVPESGPCLYKGVMVACVRRMNGGKNILYRNNVMGRLRRDGTGRILDANARGPACSPPISTTTAAGHLCGQRFDGQRAFQIERTEIRPILLWKQVARSAPTASRQAGMAVSAADYDLDGNLDIVKTNFAGARLRFITTSAGHFRGCDLARVSGATRNSWAGVAAFDMDNDGWPDILICNGHVYPEVEQLKTEARYAQQKLLYKNLRNGALMMFRCSGAGDYVAVASRAAPLAISTTMGTSTWW